MRACTELFYFVLACVDLLLWVTLVCHVYKPCCIWSPDEGDGDDGAVSLFGDDDFCLIRMLCIFVVIVVAVQENDHIRVLLDGTGLPEVTQDRPVIRPLLHRAGELAQGDQGNMELPGDLLQAA